MDLMSRFVDTVRQAGGGAPVGCLEAVGAQLVARWSEPHRRYHDLAHLRDCLDEVEHEPIVALAVWGHDVVYDARPPASAANEERSAQLMCGLLTRCELPAGVISQVARLIRLTAGHAVADGDGFGALLADADLAVLARPWPDYQAYVDAVRAEYAHVPDNLWRLGRAAVLTNLLALPRLYHLHPTREQQARTNLTQEQALLSGRS
jgi:predicted metal-dependent HD superfamily phosphohydrolase